MISDALRCQLRSKAKRTDLTDLIYGIYRPTRGGAYSRD